MSSTLAPVTFVGTATLDTVALVPSFPAPDQRQIAERITRTGGGPAATAAVAATRLGLPSAFVGAVGDDDVGERIVAGLATEGVDVSGVIQISGCRSAESVVVVDAVTAARSICTRPGPSLDITAGSAAGELAASAPWVHADHDGWPALHRLIDQRADTRPKLSVDGGNPIEGFSPAAIDLYVPTASALAEKYGPGTVEALVDAALTDGARCVVATRGAGGAIAATSTGAHYDVPAHPIEAVSTLGAGDVFHGALLAALTRSLQLRTSIAYASVAAGLSCRGIDGRSAIPGHAEVIGHLHDHYDLEPA